ncbi:MAG TPA: hypothetical protein VIV34_13830 [Pseudolabrys sp.]
MATTAAGLAPERTAAHRVSFYFAAHQDDWQLFMNPSAFHDVLASDTRSVFVHVTAGDAGLGTGNGGRKHPLYVARENGAECAIRFMADSNDRTPDEKVVSAPTFNGRAIRRISYRNTVAFFLRLPDGGPDGNGYGDTGHQSLKRLADGQIGALTAIDGTASYRGWSELTETLRSIIDFERGHSLSVELHVPELDLARNVNDHPDHYMTAKAALAATKSLNARRIHHVGYASAKSPENLQGEDRDMKCAVYAVTLAGVLALGHPVSWQHYDHSFVGRNYCRADEQGF